MDARKSLISISILALVAVSTATAAHLPLSLAPPAEGDDGFEPGLPLEDLRPVLRAASLELRSAEPAEDGSIEVQPWEIRRGTGVLMSIGARTERDQLEAHRLQQARGPITETFTSFTDGLEQELTLDWTAAGDPLQAPYHWRFIVRGGSVHVEESGSRARLVQAAAGGGAVVEVLGAVDSEGRELPARFESRPLFDSLSLLVDDRGAVAPTTVRLRWRSLNTVLEPEALLTAYGRSVASAGDIDGDGFTDLAVAARRWSEDQPSAGRVFVHRGGPSGIEREPAWTLSGSTVNGEFGAALASAGDVDGDGFDDLLVGEPGLSQVHLFLGSQEGPASAPIWTHQGPADTDCGWSVAGAGDVNGDGRTDILVGEPRADGSAGLDAGRVMLFLGGPGGPSTTADQVFEGRQGFSHFGRALASAGDVNGDGLADVLFGAPLHDNASDDDGRVVLHLGTEEGLSTFAVHELSGESVAGRFGESLAGLGDLNGDGFGDVAIAAPRASGFAAAEAGTVQVFLGPDLERAATLWGVAGAQFGQSVAAAGDVNGDGLADLAVGAPRENEGHGSLSLFLGHPTGLDAEAALVRTGPLSNSEFGMSVAGLGAADGDGFSDVAVGAWYHRGPLGWAQGRVLVLAGHGLVGPLTEATIVPEIPRLGRVEAQGLASGDLDLDGFSDVVVGIWGTDGGMVATYFGSEQGLPALPASRLERPVREFGRSVAIVADATGDGLPDVVVGSSAGEGAVLLYPGAGSLGPEPIPSWSYQGSGEDRSCGQTVIDAGDLDGDGFGDFAASCWTSVRVFHGGADGPREAGLFSGRRVSGVGDVNGDGFSDLMIDQSLHLGSVAGVSETPDFSLGAGAETAPAGDVNGDGFADVLVRVNRIRVAYGSRTGLALPQRLDYVGNPFELPTMAGDIDGDGLDDLASKVGLPFGSSEVNLYLGGDATLSVDPAHRWRRPALQALVHGDVDGDGRPDLVAARGSSFRDGELFVLHGGNGGAQRRLRVRDDGEMLEPFGRVPLPAELEALVASASPMGRQPVRLEWQLTAAGQPWEQATTAAGAWQDSAAPASGDRSFRFELPEALEGAFRWRLRLRGRSPFPWVSPWRSRTSIAHDTQQRAEPNEAPSCGFDVTQLGAHRLELRATGEDPNGDEVALSWMVTGCTVPVENVSSLDSPSLILDFEGCSGSCMVELRMSDPLGATTTCDRLVTWSRLAPSAGPDLVLSCPDPTERLQGSVGFGGAVDVSWQPAAGLDDPTALQPLVDLPGTYTLTVTERDTGCSASDIVTVVGTSLSVDAGPDRAKDCSTGVATLSAIVHGAPGGSIGMWGPPGQVADPDSPVTTTTIPGTYIYVVMDPVTGCSRSDTVVVGTTWAIEPSDRQRRPGAEPLRVEREGSAGLALSWEDTGAGIWSALRGSLASLWDSGEHDHSATAACGVTVPAASLSMPIQDSYYLAVTDCGALSSAGRDSLGTERGGPLVRCP